jgi:glutaredoxin
MSTSHIHLYWATGCTSCLRVKEFLERNDVQFVSHNVVETGDDTAEPADQSQIGVKGANQDIIDEMVDLGLPDHVPVVRVGDEWADGKDIEKVAELVGVEHESELLPVEELYNRLDVMLSITQDFLERLPEEELTTDIPNRPRSYGELVQHIFSLPDVFIMHEAGVPMDGVPRMEHSWDPHSKVALSTYGHSVRDRLADWFEASSGTTDWSATADVFWGQPTKHQFFERTTWHTGQHTRQLEWILENELGMDVDDAIDPDLWEGLPMPQKVWNK